MVEFRSGEEGGPGVGVVRAEDTEVCFNLLIGTFSLAISLWVIGSGESNVIVKEVSEFSGECRCELRASIRDDGVI